MLIKNAKTATWLVLTQQHFCKTLYWSDDGIKLFPPKWHWFSMLTVVLWENLVLVVILVLKSKALYISRVQHALLLIGRFSGLYTKVQTAWLCGALSSLIQFPRDRINILLTTLTHPYSNHIFTSWCCHRNDMIFLLNQAIWL